MLEIPIQRESGEALYLQVAAHLRRLIGSGSLPPGTRLPGTRVLSRQLDISRTTVMQAYAILEDDGKIRLEGRSGAFVLGQGPDGESPTRKDEAVDLASGLPSMDLVPVKSIRPSFRS